MSHSANHASYGPRRSLFQPTFTPLNLFAGFVRTPARDTDGHIPKISLVVRFGDDGVDLRSLVKRGTKLKIHVKGELDGATHPASAAAPGQRTSLWDLPLEIRQMIADCLAANGVRIDHTGDADIEASAEELVGLLDVALLLLSGPEVELGRGLDALDSRLHFLRESLAFDCGTITWFSNLAGGTRRWACESTDDSHLEATCERAVKEGPLATAVGYAKTDYLSGAKRVQKHVTVDLSSVRALPCVVRMLERMHCGDLAAGQLLRGQTARVDELPVDSNGRAIVRFNFNEEAKRDWLEYARRSNYPSGPIADRVMGFLLSPEREWKAE